jgi:glycosyltransferase involved in cell wall biosynthesis
MKNQKTKILFVSHASNLTGAPISLLVLAETLKRNSDVSIEFLLLEDGPLAREFEKLGRVHHLSKIRRRISRTLGKLHWAFEFDLVSEKYLRQFDLILLNTIVAGKFFSRLKSNVTSNLVLFLREMPVAIKGYMEINQVRKLIMRASLVMAPSHAVYCGLKSLVPDLDELVQTRILPQYVPDNFGCENFASNATDDLEFCVGGSGLPSIIKGTDIFIETARQLFNKYPDARIRFVWKGGRMSDRFLSQIQRQVELLELKGKVVLEEHSSNMSEFYQGINIFFLSSREDSSPRVVFEAAAASKPSICFEQSGGATEFVEQDSGAIIRFGDIDSAVEAIMAYYRDPALLEQHSLNARKKYLQRHSDGEAIAKTFLNLCFGQENNKNDFRKDQFHVV